MSMTKKVWVLFPTEAHEEVRAMSKLLNMDVSEFCRSAAVTLIAYINQYGWENMEYLQSPKYPQIRHIKINKEVKQPKNTGKPD